MCSALENQEGSNIVICAGPIKATQLQTAFLVGCHIILAGCDFDEMCSKFSTVQPNLSIAHDLDLSLRDFWSSFHQANRMGWINFHGSVSSELEENELDIEEYIHYSRSSSFPSTNVPIHIIYHLRSPLHQA
jgi:hypothetical protein